MARRAYCCMLRQRDITLIHLSPVQTNSYWRQAPTLGERIKTTGYLVHSMFSLPQTGSFKGASFT